MFPGIYFIIIVKLFKSVFYGISVCIGIFICIRFSKIKKQPHTTTVQIVDPPQMPIVQNASEPPVVQAAVETKTKSVAAGENDYYPLMRSSQQIDGKNKF